MEHIQHIFLSALFFINFIVSGIDGHFNPQKTIDVFTDNTTTQAGNILYELTYEQLQERQSEWKTYQNEALGFSIAYPSKYHIREANMPTDADWRTTELISIFDDLIDAPKWHIIPVYISIAKQPIDFHDGTIYHNVEAYAESGLFFESGSQNRHGDIVSINGIRALRYRFPKGDTAESPHDEYIFIHNDIIYLISLNADNEFMGEILHSIKFSI